MTKERRLPSAPSPMWAWVAYGLLTVAGMAWLRLSAFPSEFVPLTYGLPMLACLWRRSRVLLWAMTGGFVAVHLVKMSRVLPAESDSASGQTLFAAMQILNILGPAVVIDLWIVLLRRLDRSLEALERTNGELEASNEELAAREEEISQQNEELQVQAAELEQQMTDLGTQAEELQGLNSQLEARERTLHGLLETASVGAGEQETLERIGLSISRLFGERAKGAALLELRNGVFEARTILGEIGEMPRLTQGSSLAGLAIERRVAASLADTSLRPDLAFPSMANGRPTRSLISAPLRGFDGTAAVLEIYSEETGEWSDQELRLAQWMANQCSRLWGTARLREQLDRQQTILRAITDNSTVALFMTDVVGRFTFMNPAAERLTGRSLDELAGRTLADVVACEPGVKGRESGSMTGHVTRKDGERIPVVCVTTPVETDGRVVATVVEARDVSEQRRHEQEREMLLDSERAARSEAERAGRAKDEFVATLSHELRTPLNAIMGWAMLLRKSVEDPAELGKGLEVIERNARLQAQLISDLLDMSRITAGKIRLEARPVDVAHAVDAAVDAVRPMAEAKGLTLTREIPTLRQHVTGDAARIQQVVWNILTNAVKFTPRGGRVSVAVSETPSRVRITVTDTGQGIEPDQIPHVFERYRQADSSPSRRHGGLGLGLALVKHFVEMHGGTVDLRSEGRGTGTRCTVSLPASQAATRSAGAMPRGDLGAQSEHDLSGVRILAVDDEPDSLELVRRLLAERGAEVIAVASAEEALACFSEGELPALLISDIGMPGMDGYELIRRLRGEKQQSAEQLPAIALTAFARHEDSSRAINAGYQRHLAKPVEPSDLLMAVSNLCRAYGEA